MAMERAELVNAVVEIILEAASEAFPCRISVRPAAVADALLARFGRSWTSAGQDHGLGELSSENLPNLVAAAVDWLAREDYLHEDSKGASTLVALSEKGAVLTGVIPKALLGG